MLSRLRSLVFDSQDVIYDVSIYRSLNHTDTSVVASLYKSCETVAEVTIHDRSSNPMLMIASTAEISFHWSI